jgi:hypothetical protein
MFPRKTISFVGTKIDLLNWWFTNVHKQKRVIMHELPKITITTDASMRGWGAVLEAISIGGRWSAEEQNNHFPRYMGA